VIANNNADEISQQISNNEVMHLREQNKNRSAECCGDIPNLYASFIFVFVFFGQPVGPSESLVKGRSEMICGSL
jgi:hypothetical protein